MSVFSTNTMPSSNPSAISGSPKKNWIREASMKRLNMFMRNKAECLTDTFIGNTINLNDLEKSGLNDIERNTIDRWIRGQLSGRHCLLALLEHRLVESEEKNIKSITTGAVQRPIEFEMLSSSLSLPNDFLCDSGYLYESTFSKPPGTVIKEALQMLATKAMEKNISSLRVDQINLSLKQLRVDMLHDSVMSTDTEEGKENSTSHNSTTTSTDGSINGTTTATTGMNKASNNKEANTYRLSILIELIRWHIRTNHKDYQGDSSNTNNKDNNKHSSHNNHHNNNHNKLAKGNNEVQKVTKTSSSSSFFSHSSSHIDTQTIVQHLDCNLEHVVEEAKQLSTDDLERLNILLKPYVRQLSSLKSSLTIQLKDFEEKKAYISLGVSKDATDSAIRKAYHSKAVQLHPDKPGGDTAKFQALQTSYQDILNKRKTEQVSTNVSLSQAAQEESIQANNILKELATCLDLIKTAADKCTALGHLNIQFQKSIEKSAKKEFPDGVKSLVKLLTTTATSNNSTTATGDDKNINNNKKNNNNKNGHANKIDMTSCAPAIAVSFVETVCESMQILSALSMKLPSCGFRYGLATAINSKYMKAVEKAMATGLSAMRVVSALISANDQIYLCRKKLLESATQGIENDDIHEILVDMIVTSFNSATMTVQMAADKCVDAAINAADLYGIIKSIIHSAEEEAINDAKRTAAREEKDADLCEEDKIFMAERNKQMRAEAMAKQKQEEDELWSTLDKKDNDKDNDKKREKEEKDAKDDEDDTNDDDPEVTKEKARKRKQATADEEANGSIESLRDKIKTLQLQLRVQHVQALQSLNAEARTLQLQLQQQLHEIVTVTVSTEVQSHKIIVQKQVIARQQQEQQQQINDTTALADISKDVSKNTSTLTTASSSPTTTAISTPAAAIISPPVVQPLRNSVLSLVADFIDSSCNSLREDLDTDEDFLSSLAVIAQQQQSTASYSMVASDAENKSGATISIRDIEVNRNKNSNMANTTKLESLLHEVLYKHLGWMTVLNPTRITTIATDITTNAATNNFITEAITKVEPIVTSTLMEESEEDTTYMNKSFESSSDEESNSDTNSGDNIKSDNKSVSDDDIIANSSDDEDEDDEETMFFQDTVMHSKLAKDELDAALFDNNNNNNNSDNDEGINTEDDILMSSSSSTTGDGISASVFKQNASGDTDDDHHYDTARDDNAPSPDNSSDNSINNKNNTNNGIDGSNNNNSIDDDDDDDESTFDVLNELRKSFDQNVSIEKTTEVDSDNNETKNIDVMQSPIKNSTPEATAANNTNSNDGTNNKEDETFIDIDEGVYTTRESSAHQSPSQQLPLQSSKQQSRNISSSSSSSSTPSYQTDGIGESAIETEADAKTTNSTTKDDNNTTSTNNSNDDKNNKTKADETPQSSESNNNTTDSSTSTPPPSLFSTSSENKSLNILRVGPKLALLPDYRSKTLWLSALVDEEAVVALVSLELKARLEDCLKRVSPAVATTATEVNGGSELNGSSVINGSIPQPQLQQNSSVSTNNNTTGIKSKLSSKSIAEELCELIIDGVRSAVSELRTVNIPCTASSKNS